MGLKIGRKQVASFSDWFFVNSKGITGFQAMANIETFCYIPEMPSAAWKAAILSVSHTER